MGKHLNIQNLKPFVKGVDPRRNVKGQPLKLDNIMNLAVSDEDKILIAKKQVEKAKEGDQKAADFVFDRLFGKPHQSTDIKLDTDPNAPMFVFKDISSGQ